jgi:hypothetical protein
MNTKIHSNNSMKRTLLPAVLAVAFGFAAHAGLSYEYFSDSGAIPQGGTTFSVEQTVSGIGTPVSFSGVTLILTFNNGYDLNGNILGTLILNPAGSASYASFTPGVTGTLSPGTTGQEIYTVAFSGPTGAFATAPPNNIWALNLWDVNNSGIENGLVNWTMDINTISTVPEPVTSALALFGLVFVGVGAGRFYLRRRRQAV